MDRQEQLIGGGGVGNADRHRVEVRADQHRLDVMDGDVEGGAHRGALLDRREDRHAADAGSGRGAELRVEAGRDVLELACLADDAALFDKGLPIRRAVLGAEYVDASMAKADDFMMAFQRATTADSR